MVVFILIVGTFLFLGWYLSNHMKNYLEENWLQLHEYWFGPPEVSHTASSSNIKCFCKKPNCQRFLNHNVTFHEKQVVTERISDSLEKLFDGIIERYVDTWYNDVSEDEEFVSDIKMTLHFVCDNALHRLKKVDLSKFICTRVVPIAARHAHMCMASKEANRPNSHGYQNQNQNDRFFAKYSGHLHTAMQSRSTELLYIRGLVTAILPYLVHNTVHNHSRATILILEEILSVAVLLPALDVLATPDVLNKLILIALNSDPAPKPVIPVSPNVLILHNYHKAFRSRFEKPTPVNNIQDLYRDAPLFHQFMQYLKSIRLVDLLNVFGQLDEINAKVLQPEIPEAVKVTIHRDLALLHESLAHEAFLPLLQLPDTFLSDILRFANGPYSEVDKLQTCDSWFKTYDRVCSLLETILLPQFFDSECFFDSQYSSSPGHMASRSNSSLKRRDFSLAKLTGKVKDMLKLQTVVEGEFPPGPPTTHQAEDAAAALLLSQSFSDDSPRSDCVDGLDDSEASQQEPDLSTWEVSMPTISQGYRQSLLKSETPFDDTGRRGSNFAPNFSPSQFTFVIEVRARGFEPPSWRIHRRYQEFYVLHEKLSEFHGTHLQDVNLPSRRSFGIKNFDFLENKKPEFEIYLNKLLSKPFLYNSELLYGFLRQTDVEFNNSINIGKFMKSVNIKLKTRGQHLSNFMQTLVTSTEGRKPVPRATEPSAGRSLRDNNLHNQFFWNNASGATRLRHEAIKKGTVKPGCDQEFPRLHGIMDVVDWLLQWTVSSMPLIPGNGSRPPIARFSFVISIIRGLIRGTRTYLTPFVESYVISSISTALTKVLQEHRIVPIVDTLCDTLFSENAPQKSHAEKQLRKEAANTAVRNLLLHPPLHLLFDQEQLKIQLEEIFSFLQLPKVNKQLSYVLLDDLVEELFPELSVKTIKDSVAESLTCSPQTGMNGGLLT